MLKIPFALVLKTKKQWADKICQEDHTDDGVLYEIVY